MKKPENGTAPLKGFEVEFQPGWDRWAKLRSDDELQAVLERLKQLTQSFGKPHLHAGLGIRRLDRQQHIFEFRISKALRVVFFFYKPRTLSLAMIGNHDQVQSWLKSHR